MDGMRSLTQAYKKTPWRKQMQVVGTFLLVIVCLTIVAAIYLNVTARAATYGREIQKMQVSLGGMIRIDRANLPEEEETVSIEYLQIQLASLEAELARLKSSAVMRERAIQLGYRPVDPGQLVYIKVPGYSARGTAVLAPAPSTVVASTPMLMPAFKQSLGDWLKDSILQMSSYLQEVQP